MVTVVYNFEDIKEDWSVIYHSRLNTVFQSWKYNHLCWDKKKGTEGLLFLIVYKDNNGRVRAILPTYIDKRRTLRFINDKGTDVCDLIYDKEFPTYRGIKEISDFIRHEEKIRYVSLENISGESVLLSYLKVFNTNALVYSNNEISFLKCDKSVDPISTFTHLSSDKRKKLKRILRHTENYPFVIYSAGSGLAFPRASLEIISREMVRQRMRSGNYFNDKFWDFVEEAYASGILEVALLSDTDNKPISAGFVFHNAYISVRWVILYSDSKYNLWNNVLYIVNKSPHQTYINNFGRGGYDYKMGNFQPNVALLYKIIFPSGKTTSYRQIKELSEVIIKRSFRNSFMYNRCKKLKNYISNYSGSI